MTDPTAQAPTEQKPGTAPAEPPNEQKASAAAEPPTAEKGAAMPATPTGRTPSGRKAEPVSKTSDIVAGPGGVMTNEVGVITGELTLRTEVSGGKVTVRVQYKDADEWYVVTGGRATIKDPADVEAVHKIVTGILDRPEG